MNKTFIGILMFLLIFLFSLAIALVIPTMVFYILWSHYGMLIGVIGAIITMFIMTVPLHLNALKK